MAQLKTRILMRSDTTANWESNDPVLGYGEIGVEFLTDGTQKIKIGVKEAKKWSELEYFGGEMPEIADTNVFEVIPNEGETHSQAIARVAGNAVLAKGDIAYVKETIFTDATDSTKNKYSYTGYVYNGTQWVAMDGNYNADNVILTGNVQLSGSYTAVGNVTKSSNAAVAEYNWDGMSVRQMFENILSKVLYPSKPTPSVASWSLTNSGAKEIGTTITPSFKVKYNPGTYAYGSTKNSTAGSGTYAAGATATITLNDGNTLDGTIGGDGSAQKEITISGSSMTVTSSTNYYGDSVSIGYAEGATPLTNTGTEYADAKVSAGTCSNSTDTGKITHYREGCFYGTVSHNNAITSSVIRGLNKLGGNYSATNKTFTVPVGATKIIIACPKGKTGPSSVLNTTVNAEMWNEDNFKVSTPTVISVGGADSTATSVGSYATDYNVWVFAPNDPYDSTADIKLTLG